MSRKYLDDDGLLYLWGKIKNYVTTAVSGFYTKPGTGIPKTDLASGVQSSLTLADSALQSFTETDPVFTASVAHGITATDLINWNAAEANVVKSVNTTAGTSGVNLSLSGAGALDVTISSGSVANGNTNFVTGGAVHTAISDAISGITSIRFSIVETLPVTGEAGVIYLISNSGTGQNIYDEYIYVNNAFEKIGTTDVDLSGYLQISAKISNGEIDTIVAS